MEPARVNHPGVLRQVRSALLLLLLFSGLLIGGRAMAAGSATTATLLLDAAQARPGTTLWAAVELRMDKGWHTYWRNPGESGMATTIRWTLPAGITAGEIHWPPPESYTDGGLTTYVYHHEVLLLIPLTVAEGVRPGTHTLEAAVDWLECLEACVPGDARVSAPLVIGPETQPSPHANRLNAWRARLPQPLASLPLQARWEGDLSGDRATLVIEGDIQDGFQPTDFLAYGGPHYEVTPAVEALPAGAGRFAFQKQVSRFEGEWPARLVGLLAALDDQGRVTRAGEVILQPDGAPATAVAGDGELPLAVAAHAGRPLLVVLFLAFIGGMILNVMPCVLPVIAIKILGFVQQSQEEPARVKRLGLTYGAGVLASFLVMASVVVAVQQVGGAASWGMQMQNPYFRLILLVVVVLVALNLFGVFEIRLGSSVIGATTSLTTREGYPGAFFNGILATALGTSCTAPFLAVAVGFAFTQSPFMVLLMFLTIGAGLAFPYVLLSWHPAWLKFLPKPGLWMQHFKVAMGFPMLGAAVWIFEFTAPTYGPGGILWLGVLLVLIGVIAWIWGQFVQSSTRRRGLAMVTCLLLATTGYGLILERQLHWRQPTGLTATGDFVRDIPDGLEWWTWSPEAVQQARRQGQIVLVDFTAKWCPNCRSNKKFAIDIPSVRARLETLNGKVFRADYTDQDPRITEELKRHERAGVPLVLVYPADPAQPPIVLPALLTPGIVLEALERAANT